MEIVIHKPKRENGTKKGTGDKTKNNPIHQERLNIRPIISRFS